MTPDGYPYLQDLLDQPGAIRRTLDSLPARIDVDVAGAHRVVLTGMGNSLYACHPLQIRLNRAGHCAQMFETSELLTHYRGILRADTLTVAVSQSGESAEMARLLREGVPGPVIGVTNTDGSTLARMAGRVLHTDAGPEATVACKTYLASLAALHWLGSAMLGEDLDAARAEIAAAADAVDACLASWREHVAWIATRVEEVRRVFVVGRGWSLATAQTGGLNLKESVRIAAEGMSSAALRHGPWEALAGDALVCICEGDAASRDLNRRLDSDAGRTGARTFRVSAESPHRALRTGPVPDALLPRVEILPVQMLSLAIAASRGEQAGRFTLATKITAVE